ncbi:MAG TPA: DNA-processing protein DprA, partial [Usitatibacter sp.]
FASPQAALSASRQEVEQVAGDLAAKRLRDGPSPKLVEATLRWLSRPHCQMLALGDAAYPRALLDTPDPPCVLYARGRIELLNETAVAIVGSRNATPQGLRDAEALALALSESGLVIVSGLALGIDAAAHRGGLAGAGSSIAVMGTGPDLIYPRGNRDLASELAARGCLISEFAVGTPSVAHNFPQRNRLISGLARGVLVVEAAVRSGSLNTARWALEQGRDVFAVPGSIHSALSKGCHSLLKQGAKLVESADDVLVELGMITRTPEMESPPDGAVEHDPILDEMGFAPASIDQLAQRTGLDAAKLAAQLSCLEIAGRVRALPGGWFQRVANGVIK